MLSLRNAVQSLRRWVPRPVRGLAGADRETPASAWQGALPEEVAFWRNWFATRGASWPSEYTRRFDAQAPLSGTLHRFLGAPGRQVRILDVGAGPASSLGRVCAGYTISITAVDALAEVYGRLYEEFQVEPPTRTELCHTERLLERFTPNQFDIVYAENTLDHHYAPAVAILQMLQVARPGGYVILFHVENEAEREGYQGLHQWNFTLPREANDLLLWNKARRFSLKELLHTSADLVAAERHDTMVLVAARKAVPAQPCPPLA